MLYFNGRLSSNNATHTPQRLSGPLGWSRSFTIMGWVSCSGRHFRVKSTPNCLTFSHERHRDYTIWHWKDYLRCPLWWRGCVDFNSWGVGGADRPPGFYLPSLCSERRCRREPFQHHGAVHQPLSVLKVDRTVLTFAAWATSLVVWWNITVFRFALAIKPHSVLVHSMYC